LNKIENLFRIVLMKLKKNRDLLTALFAVLLVLSNILSVKLIPIGTVLLPGGILCFALAFLISDVINELYGKQAGKQAIYIGFIAQIFCSCLIALTTLLPSADPKTAQAFNLILKVNFWSVLASLISFLCASFVDLKVFHCLKSRLKSNYKWVWNNLSTIIGQILDTIIYVSIAFGIGHNLFAAQDAFNILSQMILGQIVVKVILALLDTPLFYLLTKEKKSGYINGD
jgi:uncharacterized integral membrane protein (TIGR00697 family)